MVCKNYIVTLIFTLLTILINQTIQQKRSENTENTQGRKGKLMFSYPQSPILDFVLKTAAPNYVARNPQDIFDFLRDSYPLPGGLESPLDEYDYIIVGAGSAGSVLAARLTEGGKVSVLLLEAGKPEMLPTDIPVLAPQFQNTDYAWQYYMEHQPGVCMGMENERCFWPRGKAVGGTSVINYMIYTRGRPQDWDRIANDGNYGWSYSNVLKYYMKSEKANLKGFDENPYRNRDGVLPVEFVPVRTKLIDAFLEAGRLVGHRTVDYNAPDGFGFGYVQVTISYGRRQSVAKVYLHKHKKRQNLHILPESKVIKVLIDPNTKAAYGVEYVRNRLKHTVKARQEVILSAGPIASPQLLMLSGVGPTQQLANVGISLIQNLPVGQTLYDHICFPGQIFSLNETNVSFTENRDATLPAFIRWLHYGDSGLTSPGAVEGIGYIKTNVSDDPDDVPDIELISIGGSIVSDGGPGASKAVRKGMKIKDSVFKEAFGSIDNTDTWSTFLMLVHPKSKGRLELKDNNPFSFPKLYGNYLTDPRDIATFIAGIRHVEKLVSTEPFQRFGAKLHPAQYQKCRMFTFDSDEYWECAIRTLTVTLHHQIGTCRMGPAGDFEAVVDPELRVHGIQGLRVVDTSVLPRTISAHTNAPGIMIGEFAADLIKMNWNI